MISSTRLETAIFKPVKEVIRALDKGDRFLRQSRTGSLLASLTN